MGITPQAVLMYLGIAALLTAVTFLLMAAYTFFHEDIRGVMDDLSGRRRASEVSRGWAGRRARTSTRRPQVDAVTGNGPRSPEGPSSGARGAGGGAPQAKEPASPAGQLQVHQAGPASGRLLHDDEDALETVVDADLGVTRRTLGVDFGRSLDEDDVSTQVATLTDDGDDVVTRVDSGTEAKAAPEVAAATPLFRVTRRIISISSREVIGER